MKKKISFYIRMVKQFFISASYARELNSLETERTVYFIHPALVSVSREGHHLAYHFITKTGLLVVTLAGKNLV